MPLFYVAGIIAVLNLVALRRGWGMVEKLTRPVVQLTLLVWHFATINQIGWQAALDAGLLWFAAGFAILFAEDLLASSKLQNARWLPALRPVAYLAYTVGLRAFPFPEYAVVPDSILALLVVLVAGRVYFRLANERKGGRASLLAYVFVVALMLYSGLATFTIREWTEWHAALAAGGVMALTLCELFRAGGEIKALDMRGRILALSAQILLGLAVILHSIFLSQL